MRPIRLTMTAFGPYAGTEVVDFTSALDAGIFGIYGETGAGKTTIFDGISFALFGQSSGDERSAEDMVCHHGHATDVTRVELVFELGAERYVVQRIPRQQRAALRGGGTTTEPHQAFLFRATGLSLDEITGDRCGDVLAEKQVNKVDPEIVKLLGYTAEQFRQIVLLPQGEFRKILTATNDERSPILKRLFDVWLYEQFTDRMRRDAAALSAKIREERVRREAILGETSEEELADRIQRMIDEIAVLETTITKQEQAQADHQKALVAGQSLAEKFATLTAAKKTQEALNGEAADIEQTKTRLKRARAAQTVLVAEAAKQSAQQIGEAAQRRDHEARDAHGIAQTKLTAAKETLAKTTDQSKERDAAATRVQELERYKQTLDQSESLVATLESARQETRSTIEVDAEASRISGEASKSLRGLRELQKLQPDHDRHLRDVTAHVTALEKEAETLGRFETAHTKRNQQASEVERLTKAHKEREEALETRRAEFERSEQVLTDIQALHVARKLAPGVPCPACGSRDHPDPATGDPKRRGRHDQFEAAEAALREAERLETEARADLGAARSVLTERQSELEGFDEPTRDRSDLLPLLTDAQEQKKALEEDQRFFDLDRKIAAGEEAERSASATLEETKRNLAEKRDAETKAQTAYETLLRDIPADWRQGDALSIALTEAVGMRDGLINAHEMATREEKEAALSFAATEEAAAGAATQLKQALADLEHTQSAFDEQLKVAKLDETSFLEAKADADRSDALEAAISGYGERVAANRSELDRLGKEIGENSPPNLEALGEAKAAADAALEESRTARTRLKRDVEAHGEVQKKVKSHSATIADLEANYGPLGGLSELVNGNNERKVRLPDFAIAAMFDEVLAAANARLEPMTGGRYRLFRPEGTGGGHRKQGLDIAVFDANTEKPRPTKTLSGGEGFQASLALALGLSDVVQQNAGGIKLDAIFIDEGFGTLDEDTLHIALETLYELTNDMRSVGLISHTDQVKSMITEGFDIEVTPSGSHIHARRHAA